MYTRGYTPAAPAIWRGNTAQIRPTTSRSLEDCVIKDFAHYKRKLSMKITQIKAELFAMNEKIKELNEDAKKMEYRAKHAQAKAKELTELQDLLSDHFTALDKANMRVPKAAMDKETAKLEEENDSAMMEQEEIYGSRVYLEQKIEKQEQELSNIIDNTVLRDAQQVLRNDAKKDEQFKLELQLWKLIQQRERLTDNAMLDYGDTSYETIIERDLGWLRDILCSKLYEIDNSICTASNLEQYQRIISENHLDGVQSDPPRLMLHYLECYLSRLLNVDKYVTRASKELTAKYMDVKGICFNMLNVTTLNDVLGRRIADLKSEISIIECQRQSSRGRLNMQEAELRANEKQLMGNEQYKKLHELENQLMSVNRVNYSTQEYLQEGRSLEDLHKCKERVLKTIDRLNATIISHLN